MDTLILEGSETLDVRDKAAVAQRIKGSVSSKQYGYESVLCPLIAEACISVCPKNPVSFNVDNVRALCPDLLYPVRCIPRLRSAGGDPAFCPGFLISSWSNTVAPAIRGSP